MRTKNGVGRVVASIGFLLLLLTVSGSTAWSSCDIGKEVCEAGEAKPATSESKLAACICTLIKTCPWIFDNLGALLSDECIRFGDECDLAEMYFADGCAMAAKIAERGGDADAQANQKRTLAYWKKKAAGGAAAAAAYVRCMMFKHGGSLKEPDDGYGKVRKKVIIWEEARHDNQWRIIFPNPRRGKFPPPTGGSIALYENMVTGLGYYFELQTQKFLIEAVRAGKAGGTPGAGGDRDKTYQELRAALKFWITKMCNFLVHHEVATSGGTVPKYPNGTWGNAWVKKFRKCKDQAETYEAGLPTTI